MPKVSIIIPFHNVEEYIRQCLDSVVNQKLQDIEIICVNDASDDSSRDIVEEYRKKDDRIKIIDIETRQGQGFARNRAIEIAKGEYIGFVDSDDYIEFDMFYELYEKAKQNDDDITICQAREYDDMNKKIILSDYYSLFCLWDMSDKVFSASDIKDRLLDLNVVLWNKIYKKSYLDKIGEKFPQGYIYEDLPFFFGTFLPAEKIQIVWKNLYIYRINRQNSTMQQFNNKILDRPDMVSLTYEKIKKFDFMLELKDKIKGWIINDLFHRYTLLKENFQREYFFKMKKVFQNLDISDIENPYWKKVYHFEGYLLVLNNDFESFNQKVFTEYLDIHKVEDRLRSEFLTCKELDNKLGGVYYDISQNYKYIQETYERAVLDYTKLFEICNERSDSLQYCIDDNMKKMLKVETDLYAEIEKKTNVLNALAEEKFSQISGNLNREISNIYENNKSNYDSLKYLIENNSCEVERKLKEEDEIKYNILNEKIETYQSEIGNNLAQNCQNLNEKIDLMIKIERENNKKEVDALKTQFERIIQEQKNAYEREIMMLKERLTELEKTPVQKIKDRIKKNRKNA